MFATKEEQRGVIVFSVTEGVGVTLDRFCAAIKAKRLACCFLECICSMTRRGHSHTEQVDEVWKDSVGRSLVGQFSAHTEQSYSPDLSPNGFHIFGQLKKALKGRLFHSDSDIIDTIRYSFPSQPNNFYEQVVHRLVN
ncbi:hypothetical protein AVEN_171181-1 [Araneus ventricosus]|uniref:Mos1 transposase HTH domain-containing protein n=1 Tax=Araneus ventricosus TaxID=182803 RepID=A0A4Y2V1R8_ARAVE|nr:hypothetical protein AVEN_171181-1 [Araneus ventricosus]